LEIAETRPRHESARLRDQSMRFVAASIRQFDRRHREKGGASCFNVPSWRQMDRRRRGVTRERSVPTRQGDLTPPRLEPSDDLTLHSHLRGIELREGLVEDSLRGLEVATLLPRSARDEAE
jgi:hypothetical protein